MTDIVVSFGANTADLNAAFAAVKSQVQQFGGTVKATSTQGAADLAKLTQAVNASKTSWLEIAAGVIAAKAALAVLSGVSELAGKGLEAAGRGAVALWGAEAKAGIGAASTGLKVAETAAVSAGNAFLSASARTLDYGINLLGLGSSLIAAAASTDKLSTAISNSSFTFEKFFRGIQIYRSGVIDAAGAAIAATGSMAQFEDSVKEAGFTSASAALRTFTGQLAEIPGTTDKVAADITAMFATIPNANAHIIEILVSLTQTLAKTGDDALDVGTKISEAFKGSATGAQDLAEILLKTKGNLDMRTLTNAFVDGLDDSTKSAEMLHAVIKATAIAQEEVVRHLREQIAWFDRAGAAGALLFGAARDQINAEIDLNNELQKRLDMLNTINDATANAADLRSDIGEGRNIAAKYDPAKEANAIQAEIDSLNDAADRYAELESRAPLFGGDKEDLAKINETIPILEKRLLEAQQKAQGIFATIPAQLARVKLDIAQLADQIGKIKLEPVTTETMALLDALGAKMTELVASQQSLFDKEAGGTVYEKESLALTISKNEALRKELLEPAFAAAAGATGVPQPLLEAIARQESGFDASRISATGARGVMQILPSTAAEPGMGVSPLSGAAGENSANDIMFAAQYLKALADKLGVDINMKSGQAAVLTRYGGADQPKGDKNYVANVQRYNTGGAGGGAGGPLDPLAQLEAQKKLDEEKAAAAPREIALQEKVAADETAILNEQIARAKAAGDVDVANAAGDNAKKLEMAKATYNAIAKEQGKNSVAAQNAAVAVINAQKAVDTEAQADAKAAEDAQYQIRLRGLQQRITEIHEAANVERSEGMKSAQAIGQDELAALRQVYSQKQTLERAHQQALMGIYREGTKEYRAAKQKELQVDAEVNAQRLASEKQIDQQIAASQKQAIDQTASTFSNAITGMITGQTRLRDAAKQIAAQVLQTYVQLGLKMVLENSGAVGQTVAQVVTGEAAKTAATTASVAARTGAETAGSAAASAGTISAVLKSIFASAGETFAGIFGFLSPVLGPAAAGPAAAGEATVLGVATGIAKFAAGAWSLPSDMIAQLHQGEMIVPAGPAATFRSMMESNSGVAGTVHVHHATNFNIAAMDSRSVKQFFNDHGRMIMRQINESVRIGAHVGLSKLGQA